MDKSLLSQLRDIDGLDSISWLPPLPGVLALLLVVIVGLLGARFFSHRPARVPAWKKQLREALAALRMETDGKRKAEALSALLRQVAMERHGRAACAGLEGGAWLDWLAQHDPAQFDWRARGQPLIEAPYAPVPAAGQDIDTLITAAEKWI